MAASQSSRQTMFFLLIVVAALIGVGLLQFAQLIGASKSTIAWSTDYLQARNRARDEGKKVLIYFTGTWCPPCRKMKKRVWTNDKIEAMVKQYYVAVKVELPRQPDDSPASRLAEQFGVKQIPAMFVVESTGLKSDLRGLQGWRQVYGFLGEHKPAAPPPAASP